MTKRLINLLIIFLLAFIPFGCEPETAPLSPTGDEPQEERTDETEEQDDEGGEEEDEDEDEDDDEEEEEEEPENKPVVVDPGETPVSTYPTPKYPDARHSVEYNDFYNNVQDELDEYGNIDYVVAQGNGTAFPIITDEMYLLLYQGSSATKGGSYIRVRAKNGAKLESVTIGTASKSKVAHTLNHKAAKSETTELAAGDRYTVGNLENCSEVCFICMGTSQSERLTINFIRVEYKGGFVAEDYETSCKEYGPLMKVQYPFKEDFDSGEFPYSNTPTYYKYGLEAGRENLKWSTWFGSFSWQNAIGGSQSVQLRVYQYDDDYEKDQFGYAKMEFFLQDLEKVSFNFIMSHYWMVAKISYCEFKSTEWKGEQTIRLKNYDDREKRQTFNYILDEGRKHDAKIRIELDPATGFPTKDHYDLILDNFIFN